MDPQDLLMIAVRATIIYFFVLFVIRILGKREIGNVTAFDFLVGLMLGEIVDEAIYGDVTMVKAIVAISVIALLHMANSWACYRSKLIDKILAASPTVLVEDGKIKPDALASERINEDELWMELRMQSVEQLDEVKKATLEPTGKVSVLKQEWAKQLQKKDLEQALARGK
jgi:uncharacterized membrane protein YcaP (DUF421 family)